VAGDAAPAAAQEAVNFASVSGKVLDPTGAPVSERDSYARQIATNVVTSAADRREGRFRFPYLRAGATSSASKPEASPASSARSR
jgi:hypothetical protein